MTKSTEKTIREKAQQIAQQINPYVIKSIKFYRGSTPIYLYQDGKSYTGDELNAMYAATAYKDMINGYNDRMVGYYDKWYRYTRMDEGAAYDIGVKMATAEPKCKSELIIIPA